MTVNRLEIVNDREGVSENGVRVEVGTRCTYECHVLGGMVKVRLPNGTEEILNPSIFPTLR